MATFFNQCCQVFWPLTKGFGLYEFGHTATGSFGGSHGLSNRSAGIEFELNAMKSSVRKKEESNFGAKTITKAYERRPAKQPKNKQNFGSATFQNV